MEHVCSFDDCDELADYALTARRQDGQVWRRAVCLVHVARGMKSKSLQEFRGQTVPKPRVTQRALTE